jgi:hypothetical protein
LRLWLDDGGTKGRRDSGGNEFIYGREHYPPMSQQNANIFEVLISQIAECLNSYPIFGAYSGMPSFSSQSAICCIGGRGGCNRYPIPGPAQSLYGHNPLQL